MLGFIHRTDDHEGGAWLIPSGEVVEVGILSVWIEIQHGLFGSEKNGDAAVQFVAKRDPAGVIVGGGLFFES